MITAFVYLVVTCSYAVVKASTCYTGNLITRDTYLKNSAFVKYQNSDIFSCASYCQSYQVCASFSFDLEQMECYLNYNNSQDRENLMTQVGIVHSDISEWPEISGGCNNKICGRRYRCQVLRTNSRKCYNWFADPVRFSDAENNAKKYYQVIFNKTTSERASAICQEIDGQLANIENEKEQQFLTRLLTAAGWESLRLWLGLNYDVQGRKWPIDLELQNYWQAGHPNDAKPCAYMRNRQWVSSDCSSTYNFICEFHF